MPVERERPGTAAAPADDAGLAEAASPLRIGLVNNMPDAALQATESQFQGLLADAAGAGHVQLRLTSFPELPRGAEALAHIRAHYWPLERLLAGSLDGLIVTGTEPRTPRLSEEPYWARFEQLLRWAPRATHASIWSCLAAHAAVQILDGIERQRLPQKRCGVYRSDTLAGHALLRGIEGPWRMPHSRWNDLPRAALERAGYTVLSDAPGCGVDAFLRESPSLFLFFQGHPEYEETTLLREYRRDVGRYLSALQAHYPTLPEGYLTAAGVAHLEAFRAQALARRAPELLERFPFAAVAAELSGGWHGAAVQLYRNWLTAIRHRRTQSARAEPLSLSAS
jgi:homoserine O-succinyltransferase/O-acetyltransferase